jgi:hypothetical protein
MPAPTPAAPAAAPSESAANAALIREIATEARASGQSLTFDPDTGTDGASDDDGAAPARPARPAKGKETPGRAKDGKFTKEQEEAEGEADELAEGEEETATEETEGEEEETGTPGVINEAAVHAALNAEGGVDMLALAKALGKTPEELGVTPAQHLALRVAQRKAKATLSKAETLADRLQKTFGDQVAARRAVSTGDLTPAIECVEGIFGMSWNELNRAVAASLAGKPLPDIEQKRELRELKKKEQERVDADKKAKEEQATAARTEEAKQFITTKIKGDKLASPEFAKLLKDAGLPSITDLVFEEMKAGYAKGQTDPKAALDKVRTRLQRQAKALAAGGLVALAPPGKKPAPVSASRPRGAAQAGAAGNSREMTDAELRQSVLKEHGLSR